LATFFCLFDRKCQPGISARFSHTCPAAWAAWPMALSGWLLSHDYPSRMENLAFAATFRCFTVAARPEGSARSNMFVVFQTAFVRFLLTPLGGENRQAIAFCGTNLLALLWDVFLLHCPAAHFPPEGGVCTAPLRAGYGNRTVSIISPDCAGTVAAMPVGGAGFTEVELPCTNTFCQIFFESRPVPRTIHAALGCIFRRICCRRTLAGSGHRR